MNRQTQIDRLRLREGKPDEFGRADAKACGWLADAMENAVGREILAGRGRALAAMLLGPDPEARKAACQMISGPSGLAAAVLRRIYC
jgi:hypothetical protein